MKIENKKNCGAYGIACEMELKRFLHLKVKVSEPNQTDLRKARVCYEVKTGAGELGDEGQKLVKGASYVIYVPVVDESRAVNEQEGFVMNKAIFLETLDSLGMIRRKTSSCGMPKITIQTFWNRKQNKPHGKKLFEMLDAFYTLTDSGEAQTLQDWLSQF